jgi:hypothetical protein
MSGLQEIRRGRRAQPVAATLRESLERKAKTRGFGAAGRESREFAEAG